jgi:hypothetical protein
VLAAVAAAVLLVGGRENAGFAATSVSLAGVVVSLFSDLYPRVMVSTLGAGNDLTATGTASSPYALRVMTVVLAVLLPVVLLYQGWTYRVFRGRLRVEAVPSGPSLPMGRTARAAPSDGQRPDRGITQRAHLVTSPRQPLARFTSWLLAWVAAWLIVRAMTAVAQTDSEGPRGHV